MSLKHIAFGFRFFSIIMLLILLVGPLGVTPVHATGECYVWKDATSGNNDGTTWADAYTDLQAALGNLSCNEIWVAAGTYTPGTNRTDTFQLTSGAAIYGGFAGTESARSDRAPAANLTILSGEIGDENIITDNSYHVVFGDSLTASTVLDGFFITAGNADGTTPNDSGGGMFLTASSPTLTNITFSANTAIGGGGMFLESSSSPILTNVTFSANTGLFAGGGMSLFDSSPILTNVTFSANTTLFAGGGMILRNSNPILTNVTFSGNVSDSNGGGMYLSESRPILTNVTLSGNVSDGDGGGMYLDNSTPILRNSILWSNTAPNNPSSAQIYGSGATISDSLVEGVDNASDPLFVRNPSPGVDGNWDGINDDYGDLHLQADSPAIDVGNQGVTEPVLPATDLDGRERVWNGAVDLGAYENHSVTYVKQGAAGADDGSSWNDAFPELRDALAVSRPGDEIWVAAGTYKPTNDADRTISFTLKDGVAIYGGFTGTESARSDRDPAANLTILSGEIGDENIITDNSYHVVFGNDLITSTVLDGFFITAGNADDEAEEGNNSVGGGMVLVESSPTLTNITFNANTGILGGGMFLGNSSPTLTNVTFSGNTAYILGGGMFLVNSSPTLTNVTFSGNSASFFGGGMYLQSNSESNSSPILRNSILWGNTASNGSQIYSSDASITLSTSLVEGGIGGTGIYNDNSTVTDGGGNLAANPMFVDAANGDLHLQADSPAIDTGTNAVISLTTDLDGNPRVVDGDLDESTIVDMGAYEYQPCPSGPVVYVDQSSTLIVRGESWETALQNPQDALNVAAACGGISEIWVAAGVYTPGVLLTDSFQLLPGVALYGGFSGGESSLDERDWVNNPTILSGDIDGNDTNSDGNSIAETPTDMVGNNSYHVVYADGSTTPITESTILDGFIITAGNADDPDVGSTEIVGGGMFLNNSSPSLTNITFSGNTALGGGGMFLDTSHPTLTNVTFITNTASTNGGGMFLFSSSPTLANVSFSYNQATRYGGAIYNNSSNPGLTNITINNNSLTGTRAYGGGIYNENSSPTLTYVTFSENSVSGSTASGGGGMINWNSSHPTLTNVTFTGNQATGTEAYGGGLLNDTGSNPTLTNVTFSNNSATSGGGGMTNNDGSSPELTNVTFSGNNASLGGGMINGYNSPNPTLRNTIFWGNTADSGTTSQEQIYTITGTPVVSDSVIEGGYTGGVNITTTNPNLGTLGNYGGFTQTIPLLPGSSAINAGDGVTCPLTDQRGNSRVGVCDIGAFESQGFTFSSPTGTNQSTIINTAFATPLGLSVTANAAGEPVDGGVVTFTSSLDNTWRTNPATFTAVIADGVVSATATANDITGGPYPVMASATGAASGVSFNLTNSAAPTTTSTTTILTSSENFDIFGESWTLTATVTSEVGTPSGSVTFKDGTQTLGTAILTNGVASFSTGRLRGGAYIFTAEYDGSANYNGSVSNALNLTANYYSILPLVFR